MEESRVVEYMEKLNEGLRKGWTAHLSPEGRIYYLNHETKISSWLPPVESWDTGGGERLPYGWETAIDKDGRTYFINHTSRTTTYESPRSALGDEEPPPQPREVELSRDPQLGFGFVAGSEKPVIVRFVTEGGPNEDKLQPGDQILRINGEDVMAAPREHVIELIRSSKQTVTLLVCQPHTNNSTRKSALLTAAKKAKLRSHPNRVRFSEGVIINGSPLYSPDACVPFIPNVLKVFLENGQTKSFKYDSTTTVQDVLNSLQEKLSIRCTDHFRLATEHIKITRRKRLTILDPSQTLAQIASKPGAHHLRCVYRVTFVPKDAYDLLQKDPVAFDYLFMQCCNDVVEERFTPELKYDVALRLAALHMQQHFLSSGSGQSKITVKNVERECGLEQFVPLSLLESMRPKELRKLLGHFLKQGQGLCPPGHKSPTALHARLHYLKIVSELPGYGSKCFPTNLRDSSPEVTLLVSPRFGLSQISQSRNSLPITLAEIEQLCSVHIKREDEMSCLVEISMKDVTKQPLIFGMEDKDAEEFVILLKGYFRLLTSGDDLPVQMDIKATDKTETVPSFHNRHVIKEAPWSYPLVSNSTGLRTLDLAIPPPPYVSCEIPKNSPKSKNGRTSNTPVDYNMNETASPVPPPRRRQLVVDERHPGVDYRTVLSMELLEDSLETGDVDVDVYEARNDQVIERVSQMEQILKNAEEYLSATADLVKGRIKAADSLVMLSQSERNGRNEDGDSKLDDVSPSGSDTDSTPSASPLHRGGTLRSSVGGPGCRPPMRRDSSFGLHSPDLLPSVNQKDNILDILEQMQASQEEGVPEVCLDPDIIDLTLLPPPLTPDETVPSVTSNVPETPPEAFVNGKIACMVNGETLNGLHKTSNSHVESYRSETDSNVNSSIDSLIASLTIPPPPEQRSRMSSEDLTAYIVPPPPSASPSAEEVQDEVIARFMAAANDIRKIIQREDSLQWNDEQDFSKSISIQGKNLYSLVNGLPIEDSLRNELPTQSYPVPNTAPPSNSDVYISSLPKYSVSPQSQDIFDFLSQRTTGLVPPPTNGLPLDLDSLCSNADSGSGDSSGYDTLTSYSDTIFSDDLDNLLWNNSPSSSDSTPVAEKSIQDLVRLPVPPTLRTSCVEDITSPLSLTSPSSTASSDSSVIFLDPPDKGTSRSTSCLKTELEDDCESFGKEDPVPSPTLLRSVSWTNLADMKNEKKFVKRLNSVHTLKQTNRRNSLNHGLPKGPSTKTIPNGETPSSLQIPIIGRSNGYKLLHPDKSTNGPSINGLNGDRSPFLQAQKDISAMVSHLQKVQLPIFSDSVKTLEGVKKIAAAKDALANESRQFVTSSKFFVKSALESPEKMVEHMALCVAHLNRMTTIGELVVMRAPHDHLLQRLQEVAATYFHVIDAAQQVVGKKLGDSQMANLMQRATGLATALTALMRTLQSM